MIVGGKQWVIVSNRLEFGLGYSFSNLKDSDGDGYLLVGLFLWSRKPYDLFIKPKARISIPRQKTKQSCNLPIKYLNKYLPLPNNK